MADEGAAGPDTLALEVAIHALEARDEPDRLWVEARAELAALVAAAGRAGALAAALRPILGASVWQRGVTGTEFVHPETQINVTMKRKHLEALQAAARGVPADARPGAAGAGEEATMLADGDAVLSKARREWAMAFLTRTWPLPMRDDGESAQSAVRGLFLAGGWSDRGELDALDCACIAAALWGFQAGYGTARTYPEEVADGLGADG